MEETCWLGPALLADPGLNLVSGCPRVGWDQAYLIDLVWDSASVSCSTQLPAHQPGQVFWGWQRSMGQCLSLGPQCIFKKKEIDFIYRWEEL